MVPFPRSHLYINSGRLYLSHVPSTFATVNTHANVFFVFLPAGGTSKFTGNLPGIYLANIECSGVFRGTPGRPKIAHGSHNDVRRLCWLNLGCESPLAGPRRARSAEGTCVGRLVGGGALTGVYVYPVIFRGGSRRDSLGGGHTHW